MPALLPDGVVVVSPHLDDGVLSLGSAMAAASSAGSRVTVLTVFAGDPDSTKEAGKWDRRGGFSTEGEATKARREEDLAACGAVGAASTWLQLSETEYAGRRHEEPVWRAVHEAVSGAAAVLVPGFPLTNPDHAWLTSALLRRGLPCDRVGLYAEQPYRYWERRRSRRPVVPLVARVRGFDPRWTRVAGYAAHVRVKRRAVLEYRSQTPLLGLDCGLPRRLDRLLAHEALVGGEAVTWLRAP